MKQSDLFSKTTKETSLETPCLNASYVEQAGFATRHMSGAYALLPLGLKVVNKIESVIRNELDNIGAQELLLNVLQPENLWQETCRWDELNDVLYKIQGKQGIALGPTHEEQVTDLARRFIKSYRDLPKAIYQVQTKFRREARAKSGLLRGREFIMKDLYSFHATEDDLEKYYVAIKDTYFNIFRNLGLPTVIVEASGGAFSKFSHEFQVLTDIGEDTIYICNQGCGFAQNEEIATVKSSDKCPNCDNGIVAVKQGIEVGNIFQLKNRFSGPMKANFTDVQVKLSPIQMGCYGIGITRALATIIELNFKDKKMTWPKGLEPYGIHLLSLGQEKESTDLYQQLLDSGFEVLFDDRDVSNGQKFADSDLIGCPIRICLSKNTLETNSVEIKYQNEVRMVKLQEIGHFLSTLE